MALCWDSVKPVVVNRCCTDDDLDDVDLDDLPESKKEEVLRSIREGGAAAEPAQGTTLGGLLDSAQQTLGGVTDGVRGLAAQAGGLMKAVFGGRKPNPPEEL